MIRVSKGDAVTDLLCRVTESPHEYHTVTLCSPFIDSILGSRLLALLRRARRAGTRVRILTRRETAEALTAAGIDLEEAHPACLKVVSGLHAKVYVALGRRPHRDVALVTSANLTEGGVAANRELGILMLAPGDQEKHLVDELSHFLRRLVESNGPREVPRGG